VKKIAILGLIVFLIVLLGGCARLKTKNYAPPTWEEVTDEYLEKFVGKDISAAQKVFCYKYTINQLDENRKAYIWEMDRQMGTLLTSTKTRSLQLVLYHRPKRQDTRHPAHRVLPGWHQNPVKP